MREMNVTVTMKPLELRKAAYAERYHLSPDQVDKLFVGRGLLDQLDACRDEAARRVA